MFGQPMSPSSQLLNEALLPLDDEETLRMEEEPSNNVAYNIYPNEYPQELATPNWSHSAQVRMWAMMCVCCLIASFVVVSSCCDRIAIVLLCYELNNCLQRDTQHR